jgi:acyl-CoA synthetase (AMP-forming)/AMP-acid ligase II
MNPIESGTGELVYRGRNVSLGYAERREDLARPDENRGVLRTGDVARRDADGFFYIVGRKKRFIKLFGNRVSLDEAEAMVRNIAADCACVGVDDKLTIFLTDASKASEVVVFLSGRMGIHPSAFATRVIDSIPKNGSGKTNYSGLETK